MSVKSNNYSPLNMLRLRDHDNVMPRTNSNENINISIDGGGTGGIVALGFVDVLKNEGIFDRADSVSGTSIGASIGAVAITDQIFETEDVIRRQFIEKGFIRPARILMGKPMVDLGILEDIVGRETPIDTQKLASNPTDLYFGITDLTNYQLEIMSKNEITKNDHRKIIPELITAVHLPRVAGKPRLTNGIARADGGLITEDTPDIALAKGATHVINIATKPRPAIVTVDEKFTTFVGRWIQRHGHPDGLEKFRQFSHRQADKLNSASDPRIQRLYPSVNEELPDVVCKDPLLLRKGFIAGQNAAMLALGMTTKEKEPRPKQRDSLRSIIGNKALRAVYTLAP